MTFEETTRTGSETEAGDTGALRSGGERSEPERSSAPAEAPTPSPDPEVPAKAVRRRFTAEYKRSILEQADACKGEPGKLGELLRRAGLYSSHLALWRKQRRRGELRALAPQKRGRKARPKPVKSQHEKELERENRLLRRRNAKVELMLEIQKKTSELLGIPLSGPGSEESD